MEWSSYINRERDANQKTKNLINRRINFLYNQELEISKSNSEKLFFPWAYNFIETKRKL